MPQSPPRRTVNGGIVSVINGTRIATMQIEGIPFVHTVIPDIKSTVPDKHTHVIPGIRSPDYIGLNTTVKYVTIKNNKNMRLTRMDGHL